VRCGEGRAGQRGEWTTRAQRQGWRFVTSWKPVAWITVSSGLRVSVYLPYAGVDAVIRRSAVACIQCKCTLEVRNEWRVPREG